MDETLLGLPIEAAIALVAGFGGAVVGGLMALAGAVWSTREQRRIGRESRLEASLSQLNTLTWRVDLWESGEEAKTSVAKELFPLLSLASSQCDSLRLVNASRLLGDFITAFGHVMLSENAAEFEEEFPHTLHALDLVVTWMHDDLRSLEKRDAPRSVEGIRAKLRKGGV